MFKSKAKWLKASLLVREIWNSISDAVESDAVLPAARSRNDVTSEILNYVALALIKEDGVHH